MKTIFQNRWLIFTLRLVLGVIFIIAAIAKLIDIAGFINTINSYNMITDSLSHVFGYIIPWVELFIGCSLILGVFVRFSAIITIPLIMSFTVANSYALANAVGSSCGCFGTFLSLSHPVSLILDILVLLAALILVLNKSQDFLSIRQLLQKLKVNSKAAVWGGRGLMVVLALFAVEIVSIQSYQYFTLPHVIVLPNLFVITPQPLDDTDKYLRAEKPAVVFFYANGCPACKETKPLFSDMTKEFMNNAGFVSIEYSQNPQAVSDLDIKTTPTILVITGKNSDGTYNVLGRFEGTINRDALQTCIEQAINSQ